jgi:hypothetical protein
MQRIFVKKCFLFTVGRVCHVKQFTIRSRNSLKDRIAYFSIAWKRPKSQHFIKQEITGKLMSFSYKHSASFSNDKNVCAAIAS